MEKEKIGFKEPAAISDEMEKRPLSKEPSAPLSKVEEGSQLLEKPTSSKGQDFLEEHCKKLIAEKNEMAQSLVETEERNKNLKRKLGILEKTQGPFTLKQKLEKSLNNLEKTLKENRELQKQNLKLNLLIQKQNEQVAQLSQKSQSYEDIEVLFKDQLNSYRKRNAELTRSLEMQKTEFKQLEETSRKTYRQLKKAEDALGDNTGVYSEKSYHALKQQNVFLEEKVKKTVDQINFLQTENQRLEKENFDFHLKEQKFQQSYEKVQKQSDFYSSSGALLKEQLESFKTRCEKLEIEVNELKEKNLSYENKIKEAQRKVTLKDLNERIPKEAYQRLADQNILLKQKFEQNIDKMARLQVENSELQKEALNASAKADLSERKYKAMKSNFDIFSQREHILKDKLLLLNQKNHVLQKIEKELKLEVLKFQDLYKKTLRQFEEAQNMLLNKKRHVDNLNHRIRAYAKYHRIIKPLARKLKDKEILTAESLAQYHELKERYERDLPLIEEAKALRREVLKEKNKAIRFERTLDQFRNQHDESLERYLKEIEDHRVRYQKKAFDYEQLKKDSFKMKKDVEMGRSLKEQVHNLQLLWRDGQKKLEKQQMQNQNLQKLNQSLSFSLNQYREKLKHFKEQVENSQFQASEILEAAASKPHGDVRAQTKVAEDLQKLIDEVQSSL